MKAIRNKGHRVGNVANDDLYQKEKRRQPKHGDEAAFFSAVSTHFKLMYFQDKESSVVASNASGVRLWPSFASFPYGKRIVGEWIVDGEHRTHGLDWCLRAQRTIDDEHDTHHER